MKQDLPWLGRLLRKMRSQRHEFASFSQLFPASHELADSTPRLFPAHFLRVRLLPASLLLFLPQQACIHPLQLS